MVKEKKFCFCILALGKIFCDSASLLIQDINKYAPSFEVIVCTNRPAHFKKMENVITIKHNQKGLWHPCNDKRFAVLEALKRYETAFYIDADTRIKGEFPKNLKFYPGFNPKGSSKNLIKILSESSNQHSTRLAKKLGVKLGINLNQTHFLNDYFFAVRRDNGKELGFIRWWGIISSYLELHKFKPGDGFVMGLAAQKIGWDPKGDLDILKKLIINNPEGLGRKRSVETSYLKFKRKLGYSYRRAKATISALRNFDFYYR